MTFFAAIFQKDKKKILYNQCRILFDQIWHDYNELKSHDHTEFIDWLVVSLLKGQRSAEFHVYLGREEVQ
jgi:hypothetical protein